jgi:hypothetical protein
MGWSINIKSDVLPDPKERISSCCSCPGNFYYSVMEMTGKQLRNMKKKEAIEALHDLILEVDKGNAGMFTDEWAVDADQKWSKGEETRKEYEKFEGWVNNPKIILPFTDYTSFCGSHARDNVRESALRFFLYYKAGYEITYKW